MPIQPTYPGVYIEELSSGVRTITGVATSITAFIGYTKDGPVNKAEAVNSFSDFERKFGGLARDSVLSYSVQHYFNNGGESAYIVRLAKDATCASVTLKTFKMDKNALKATARVPSSSANGFLVDIDYDTPNPDSTFNLRITDPESRASEAFLGVTMNPQSKRNVDKIVKENSQLIEVQTDQAAINDIANDIGVSNSGPGIDSASVKADCRRLTIMLNEDDGPKTIEIYDGNDANKPNNLDNLAKKITDAVVAIDAGREPYKSFSCTADPAKKALKFTSGEKGAGSFVRVSGADALDAARALKLGTMNGGREIDAAASIRPACGGTTSGDLESLPSFDADRSILVSIDGDGPHEVSIYKKATDQKPADVKALQQLLQSKLKTIKPKQAGSMAFMGITSRVIGSAIQIQSGSSDADSIVKIENNRIISVLHDCYFTDAKTGWAVGDGGTILATADGGATWNVQNSGVTQSLYGIYMVDANKGWAVGEGGKIVATTDGGATQWKVQDSGVPQSLYGIYMVDVKTGWAVGEGGKIVATADGGATQWKAQDSGVPQSLYGIYMADVKTGWAVGDGGKIVATIDGGASQWKPQTSGVSKPLNGIYMVDANKGWAVGDGGTIIATTNGKDWTAQASNVAQALLGIYIMADAKTGWAVGDGGTIITTANGKDWTAQASNVAQALLGIYIMADAKTGWAVGDGGTILATTDGTNWALQQCLLDKSAEDLKLSNSKGCQNVKTYTMGLGKNLAAQTGVTPGQSGLPPRPSDYAGSEAAKTGLYALLDVDLFNILCLPEVSDFDENDALAVLSKAVELCKRRRAFLIIDCPAKWKSLDTALENLSNFDSIRNENAAMYFPQVQLQDPLDGNRLRTFPPCGLVAGIYARTDTARGVWKAPAGQEASLSGVKGLIYKLTDQEHGKLNPLGLNCLRVFPVTGSVVWGARTLHGADVLVSDWKYIPVRRLALYIEETLYRGTKWVVFEPNDEPLWSQIRLNIGSFMQGLFRQGAFQGKTPHDAYFVKCDKETTTQNDINLGIVNILVGFAPLKPAEFVMIKIQQMAGQIAA